jgi:hypothetical protein
MRTRFHDRHDRLAYLKACEVARRIAADPSLLEEGQRHLERFAEGDPHAAKRLALWRETLTRPAEEVAALLVEDSPRGQALRDTRPAFVALPPEVVAWLIEQARNAEGC